jgi:hypothetical protein
MGAKRHAFRLYRSAIFCSILSRLAGKARWSLLLLNRFYDVLLSVYLYNEKRGFLYLDQLLAAFEKKYPGEAQLIAAIRKHAADERHHHSLFQAYFQSEIFFLVFV